jgi:hypothetical protein
VLDPHTRTCSSLEPRSRPVGHRWLTRARALLPKPHTWCSPAALSLGASPQYDRRLNRYLENVTCTLPQNLPANTYTVWISLPNVGAVPAPGIFTVPLTVTNISPLRGSFAGAVGWPTAGLAEACCRR